MSGSLEPSHVLKAIGVDEELARSVIRLSVGRITLEAEVDYAMMKLIDKIREFRRIHERATYSESPS
jgi:cysteine desulfurase